MEDPRKSLQQPVIEKSPGRNAGASLFKGVMREPDADAGENSIENVIQKIEEAACAPEGKSGYDQPAEEGEDFFFHTITLRIC